MPIGQGVLTPSVLDVDELDRIESRIEMRERRRSTEHAEQLLDALALDRTLKAAGMQLTNTSHLALSLNCSESRAAHLLDQAKELQRLGALDAMRAGLLTVEQSNVVIGLLQAVDDALAVSMWERLAERLERDREQDIVRPPARLRELLTGWLIKADPDRAKEQREAAVQDRADVESWRQDDGVVDLLIRSLTPSDARAVLDLIEQHSQPLGPDDDRPAGLRRRDAARDLLLGRIALPFDADTGEVTGGCCPPGSTAPCGASIFVHVPLDAALEESTQPAELVGHGPIDPAALGDLLLADPVLHRVWVDSYGTPVAVDDRTWRPGRGDPHSLTEALQDMRAGPPPDQTQPRHPDDHPEPPGSPPNRSTDPPRPSATGPRVLRRPHLADAGPYRPSRRQQRLLRIRAPRCEWPGCGRRASRAVAAGCDLDHDLAWPYGPTCACNLGPLCRRHHRIKQLGWIKHRQPDGSIRWTSPTGRSWTSPNQHARPEQPRPRRRPPQRQRVAPGVWRLSLAA